MKGKKGKNPWVVGIAILVGLFCVLCGTGAALIGVGFQRGNALKEEAFAWAEPALKKMSTDWQPSTTNPYLFDKSIAPTLVDYNSTYGRLKSLSYPTGSWVTSLGLGRERNRNVKMFCDAEFDKGKGRVRITVHKYKEGFRILRLTVYPPGKGSSPVPGDERGMVK